MNSDHMKPSELESIRDNGCSSYHHARSEVYIKWSCNHLRDLFRTLETDKLQTYIPRSTTKKTILTSPPESKNTLPFLFSNLTYDSYSIFASATPLQPFVMDDKHPDLAPPPYTAFNEQLADTANVPPRTEANIVEWKDGDPVFSHSVMIANQKLHEYADYDKRDGRVPWAASGKCSWQHCKNLHPHRHFWARNIYKHNLQYDWGKAFEGIVEKCGWENCTEAQEGHWHTFMAMNQDALSFKVSQKTLLHPSTKQELVLAITATSFLGHVKDRIIGKGDAEWRKEFQDYEWLWEDVSDGDCNAGS